MTTGLGQYHGAVCPSDSLRWHSSTDSLYHFRSMHPQLQSFLLCGIILLSKAQGLRRKKVQEGVRAGG